MKTKFILVVIAALCLSLSLASCAKKRTEPLPPGATKVEVKEDPVDWGTPAPSGPTEAELKAQQLAQAITEAGNVVYFGFDSSALSETSREVLSLKSDILKRYPGLTMVVEGYCDERGTVEYNLALGERRARASYDYLVILGVSPDRLSIVSFGEENPRSAGSNEEAWAQNRRDQFRVFK